jgi:hypothetical protein
MVSALLDCCAGAKELTAVNSLDRERIVFIHTRAKGLMLAKHGGEA